MLKVYRKRSDYHSIKICSDIHYGHDKEFLYGPRGFKSAKEHNDWIDYQFETLHPDDLLICLGDVGLTIGPGPIMDFLDRIPCKTLMVWGNHNSGVMQAYKNNLPIGYKNHEIYPLYITQNIAMMGESFMLNVDSDRFFCTHMAPLIFHEQNRSRVCICGHSHGNLKQINPDRDDFGKILDCGVENAKAYNGTAFFDIDEVVKIMAKKQTSSFDHH